MNPKYPTLPEVIDHEYLRYKRAVEKVKPNPNPELDLILDQVWHGLHAIMGLEVETEVLTVLSKVKDLLDLILPPDGVEV